MTLKERRQLFNRIFNAYSKEMYIHGVDNSEDDECGYTYISKREITLPKKWFNNPSEWAIFVLLHEVGHVKTNTMWMPLYEKEYLATQWAADVARKIGFHIATEYKDTYQEYIWGKRTEAVKKRTPNVAKKQDLVIKW